jgi:AraC-like DNA-binding protein
MDLASACFALFDQTPDVVFFCKDLDGRYTHANRSLLTRLGLSRPEQLLGKTSTDVFPAALAGNFWQQDQRVIRTGRSVVGELERHLFANQQPGWCLTVKHALTNQGKVCGIAGISRDLRSPSTHDPVYQRLASSLVYARDHCTDPLTVQDFARHAGLSLSQLERHILGLMQLSPSRWLLSLRLDVAIRELEQNQAIADVAAHCGFADHSAFARAFRRHVGLTPSAYRALGRRALTATPSGQRA